MSNSKTRAAVPPPPSARKSFLPETVLTPADNMRDERIAMMTFKMPELWHREFKVTATMQGLNMKELLIEAFDAWKREQAAKQK